MSEYSTLIDAKTLFSRLDDPAWVIVDCRFNLIDTEAGYRDYCQAHIPGAVYAHLDRDLSAPVTAASGRHPLPEIAQLSGTLARWGVEKSSQLVAYDDAGGSIAARLWSLLRSVGLTRCAVLDGGWSGWCEAGLAVDAETPVPVASRLEGLQYDERCWVDLEEVRRIVDKRADALLVDARAAQRYLGTHEPIDPVGGHIPGAINMPLSANLRQGRFLSPAALRERFVAVLADHSPEQIVHYCGSGVTACHNQLAMAIAGLEGSRVYAGSWSEWLRHRK